MTERGGGGEVVLYNIKSCQRLGEVVSVTDRGDLSMAGQMDRDTSSSAVRKDTSEE